MKKNKHKNVLHNILKCEFHQYFLSPPSRKNNVPVVPSMEINGLNYGKRKAKH